MRWAASLSVLLLLITSPLTAGAATEAWPDEQWATAEADDAGMDAAKLAQARDYGLTGDGSGMIVRHGKLILSWGDLGQRYDLKSTTKSIGVTALGLAIADGKMKLADPARRHHPTVGIPPESNRDTDWLDEITLFHLATQTAGFEKPGGYGKLLFRPGSAWHYSDAGPNWLAECVTLAYKRDVEDLLFERVFTPIGISRKDLVWRKNQYRPHEIDGLPRREFGAGAHANVDAMARIGLLYLRDGRWRDTQILPKEFVHAARNTPPELRNLPLPHDKDHGGASSHYGLLWWNNNDGTLKDVPRDACWSWGLYDSLIVVVPSLDVVVARAGKSWKREPNTGHYEVLRPFLEPIISSVRQAPQARRTIRAIEWAPAETVVRRAEGSDNWPMTWADDDALYTAYGDGWGFEPKLKQKLSLGLARVAGAPGDLKPENLRAPTFEQLGDGARGRKASGMLMVDGRLHAWVRNAANSTLAWSDDRGRTWSWSDWTFKTSFGCPTFLNFGRNYAGARDGYVYTYSQDHDDAYTVADRVVLARVPKDRVMDRDAYEFFSGASADGAGPQWTRDVAERNGVIDEPKACYRCGVTYNAPLKRYLLAMTLPKGAADTKDRQYDLRVYESPEPWGPWTRVRFANEFAIDAGESAGFPTKWMSTDGRTVHLVFAGGDSFSVRRATLRLDD